MHPAQQTQHNLGIDFITTYTIVNFPRAFYTLIHSSPGTPSSANITSTHQLFKKFLSRLGSQQCSPISQLQLNVPLTIVHPGNDPGNATMHSTSGDPPCRGQKGQATNFFSCEGFGKSVEPSQPAAVCKHCRELC